MSNLLIRGSKSTQQKIDSSLNEPLNNNKIV